MAFNQNLTGGWSLGPIGGPSQSTMQISPQQAAQIQATTATMASPGMPQTATQNPVAQQQQMQMFNGLFSPNGLLGGKGPFSSGGLFGGKQYSPLTGDDLGAANPPSDI